jgi:hypothetical protein
VKYFPYVDDIVTTLARFHTQELYWCSRDRPLFTPVREIHCLTRTDAVCYLYTHAVSLESLWTVLLLSPGQGCISFSCQGIQIVYGSDWYLWALMSLLVTSGVWDSSYIFGNIVDLKSLVNISCTENFKAPCCCNIVLHFVHVHWCSSHVGDMRRLRESRW